MVSLSAFYRIQLKRFLGSVRYPDPKQDGERGRMLWGQLAMATQAGVFGTRAVAPHVLWVSPYDKSDDPISGGKGTTPDLPGKLAYGCAGWFDFVGYLTAQTLSPTAITREVSFAPSATVLTRQRLPRPLTRPITIPEGGGGWQAIYTAMQAALVKPAAKA